MQIRVLITKERRRQPNHRSEMMWYSQVFTDHRVDDDKSEEIDYAIAEYWDRTWQESISKAFVRLAKAKWHWHNDRLSELILRGRNDG